MLSLTLKLNLALTLDDEVRLMWVSRSTIDDLNKLFNLFGLVRALAGYGPAENCFTLW